MHEIGRGSTQPSAEDIEVFSTLKTVEPSERVTIRLDEHALHLTGRKGNNATVRLGAIDQTVHHSTTLMPNWAFVVGAVCVWIGYRVMLDPMFRFGFTGVGLCLIGARLLTRKPTVTVTTTTGDAYVMVGKEDELARLQFMLNKVMGGIPVPTARHQWDRRQRALLNGALPDELEIETPVVIHHPKVLDALLHGQGEDVEAPEPVEAEDEPEWKPTDAPIPSNPYLPADSPVHPFQFDLEVAGYHHGHRPVPTAHPVLVTVAPPMHQPTSSAPSGSFIPNFWRGDQAHIPSTPTLPTEEELVQMNTSEANEGWHDAVEDDLMMADRADKPASPTVEPRPHRVSISQPTRRLVQRAQGRPTPFTRRKPRGLVARSPAGRSLGRLATDAYHAVRDSFTGRGSSQTGVELRDTAQRTNMEIQEQGRFGSLSHQMSDEAIERLEAHANQLLAVSESIDGGPVDLDRLSFSELQPTVVDSEPALDEW